MKIDIVKVDSGRYCMHDFCKKDPQYITPKGRIKKGTIVAKISHKTKHTGTRIKHYCFFYCRTCIDKMLLDCRAYLDSKLWAFV